MQQRKREGLSQKAMGSDRKSIFHNQRNHSTLLSYIQDLSLYRIVPPLPPLPPPPPTPLSPPPPPPPATPPPLPTPPPPTSWSNVVGKDSRDSDSFSNASTESISDNNGADFKYPTIVNVKGFVDLTEEPAAPSTPKHQSQQNNVGLTEDYYDVISNASFVFNSDINDEEIFDLTADDFVFNEDAFEEAFRLLNAFLEDIANEVKHDPFDYRPTGNDKKKRKRRRKCNKVREYFAKNI